MISTQFFTYHRTNATVWFDGCVEQHLEFERIARGLKAPHGPVAVSRLRGRRLPDFLWVGTCPLINERVQEALTEAGATGWGTFPTEVMGENRDPIVGYAGLQVLGRTRSITINKSRIEYRKTPSGKHLAHYCGLDVDLATWDGSDFFTPSDNQTTFRLVTEKVRMVLEQMKFTNVEFCSIDDYAMLAPVATRRTLSGPAK